MFIDFQPSLTQAFRFSATFDGQQYECVVAWNTAGQRQYVTVTDGTGVRIATLPVIGSPHQLPLEPPPSFEVVSFLTWTDTDGGTVSVEMAAPSMFVLGNRIEVSGATNSGTGGDSVVNGEFVINTYTDSTHFTYLLTAEPGVIGTIGGEPVLTVKSYSQSWSIETGSGVVTAHCASPHKFPLGTQVDLTIATTVPDGYNGRFRCSITTPTDFEYPLAVDPGIETAPGNYSPDINILGGYFRESVLIYRVSDQRFEVYP